MLGAIKYNLTHLLDVGGRDARQTFWYYVLFLVLLNYAIGLLAVIPVIVGVMSAATEAASNGANGQQALIAGPMGVAMGGMLWVSIGSAVLMALALVAAFVRRLHDSNRSGWWVLLPLEAQALSIAFSIRMMGAVQDVMHNAMNLGADPSGMQGMMERQREFTLYGLPGWIGPIVVIAFGVIKSTDGPN